MRTLLKDLRNQYTAAKIKAGDFRGLKANRFKNCQTAHEAAEVMFYSVFNDGKKRELEFNIEEIGCYGWTFKELSEEVRQSKKDILTINFSVNIWNKERTDAERKPLFSFTYYK